jgi:hypothetical protein
VSAVTSNGRLKVYVSWNGATEVARWRAVGGADKASLAPLGDAPWEDFETLLEFPAGPGLVQVQALDAAGNVIGASEVVKPGI